MSGTDVAYGGTRFPRYNGIQPPVKGSFPLWFYTVIQCPVLIQAIVLRRRYAMSCTDPDYGPTPSVCDVRY
eukprot:2412829-Rhodomonas_salina.2